MNKRYYLIIFIALIILNFIFIMMTKPILFIFSFIGLCVYIVYLSIKLIKFIKIRFQRIISKKHQPENKMNNNKPENNLEYLNNIIKKEEPVYRSPIIEEDYQKRIEYINHIISNIENKTLIEEPFIQKETYKIDYKNELNDQQLQAVQTINGALLIAAGAGSGKTKTLSYRTAYMLENGVNQSEILLLTFTRKSAKEMLDRTQKLLELKTMNIQGGTFHSFANNVLRKYSNVIDMKADFTIIDTVDSEDVIDLVRRELKLEKIAGKPMPKKSSIQKIISMSKNFRKSIKDIIYLKYPNLEDFIPSIELIYNSYIEYNKAHNLYDYDDLLEQLYQHLKNNIQFKNILQNKYKYIMVDEFQDTNIVQKLIINELSDKYKNVMAVGDDAQSIYSFRGANFENILIFPDTYPDCKIIKLEKNYRSSQSILNFSNDIINNFTIGYKKQLFSDKKDNDLPLVKRFGNEEDEAEYIKNEIINLYNNGSNYKDISILYRSSYHSNFIQTSLTLAGIPYQVFGGIKFIERRHIRDIISYLRIFQNPLDAVSWNRILLLLDNIGRVTASKIIKEIENHNGKIDFLSFNKDKYYDQLLELENILNTNNKEDIPISLKIENLKNYYAPILENKGNDADKRLLDIDVLITMSNKYEYDLEKFLSDFTLEPPENQFQDGVNPNTDKNKDYVTLSTIHSAKGLEWTNVFIIHALDGLFPSAKAIDNIESLEEERRLFYVASTRAKSKLYLTMPAYSYTYNGCLELPSRFITEIDKGKYVIEN